VERVLVVALAGTAGRLDEEHRLQREDIGPDQPLDHVEQARVEEEALVDLEPAVEEVDAVGESVLSLQMIEQLVDVAPLDQPPHYQEALLAEADVLVDGHRSCHGHDGTRAPLPGRWPCLA
jgi:hypothetical protein